MWSNKILRFIILTALFSISLHRVLKINPYLFQIQKSFKEQTLTNPVIYSPIKDDVTEPLICGLQYSSPSMYRMNENRNAVYSVPSLNFDLVKLWSSKSPINETKYGASKSSVVSDGRSLFVGTDTNEIRSYNFEGDLLWSYRAAKINETGFHGTPAVDHTGLYIGSYSGYIYKLNRDSGKIIWRVKTMGSIGSSPLIVDDNIVISVELPQRFGFLLKLNKMTGEKIWTSFYFNGHPHSSPSFDRESNRLFIGSNNGRIYAVDYQTGHFLWQRNARGEIKSTPVIFKNGVYVSSWNGQLVKYNKMTGRAVWRGDLDHRSQVTPIILRRSSIAVVSDHSGALFAFDLASGEEKWKIIFNFNGQISSPLGVVHGKKEKILFYCEPKTLCLITDKGKVEKRWPIKYHFTGSLNIENEHLALALNSGPLVLYQIKWK